MFFVHCLAGCHIDNDPLSVGLGPFVVPVLRSNSLKFSLRNIVEGPEETARSISELRQFYLWCFHVHVGTSPNYTYKIRKYLPTFSLVNVAIFSPYIIILGK